MKKNIGILLALLIITSCTTSITKKYPQVEKDFLESDYDDLKGLSKDCRSYQDLCEKYIDQKCNAQTKNIIKSLNSEGDLLGLKCKKTKKLFTLTYNYKVFGKTIKTTIVTTNKQKSNELKSISFDLSDNFSSAAKSLINIIENDEDTSSKIYSGISDDFDISNNIYSSSGSYYYLPLDGDELKIFASSLDIPETYQSGTEYFDKVIDENDRVIDELEKSLEETERLYGRLR